MELDLQYSKGLLEPRHIFRKDDWRNKEDIKNFLL